MLRVTTLIHFPFTGKTSAGTELLPVSRLNQSAYRQYFDTLAL